MQAQNDFFTEELMNSMKRRDLEMSLRLVQRVENVNYSDTNNVSLLMLASILGYTEVCKILIDKGAEFDLQSKHGITGLKQEYNANVQSEPEKKGILNLKNNYVAMEHTEGATALMMASQKGHMEIATMLVDNGANLNLKSNNGETALMVASANGRTKVVKLLLDKGADFELQNSLGTTSLIMASQNGNFETVKLLLDRGTNLDLQANNGATALMLASQEGHLEVVNLLIEKGAKLDLQANNGATALMLASQYGHEEVVSSLLEKGANPNLKSNEGKTAYDYAGKDISILILFSGSKYNY
jgi:serine/threonine-protein phosphatase 6 regulatory ankyrin repeat subunit B